MDGREWAPGANERAAAPTSTLGATFVAVGDILLSRGIEPYLKQYGWNYPFEHVHSILQQGAVVFGNLENPVSSRGAPHADRKPGASVFRADPAALEGLCAAGFVVLSVANNHIRDCGETGLADTLAALKSCGLRPVGAGRHIDEARQPVFLEAGGLKIAILAYCSAEAATLNQAGTAPMIRDQMVADVTVARRVAQVVIVSLHSGIEYCPCPTDHQQALAHALVDAGAALVIGHHPHLLQGYERYQHGLIFYSLGDFVFDTSDETVMRHKIDGARCGQVLRHIFAPEHLRLDESVILRCHLTAEGVEVFDLIPIRISLTGQPTPLSGDEAQRLLCRIEALSALLRDPAGGGARQVADCVKADRVRRDLRRNPLALVARLPRLRWGHWPVMWALLTRTLRPHSQPPDGKLHRSRHGDEEQV